MRKKEWKRIASLILLIFMVATLFIPFCVNADVLNDSKSEWVVTNSDGKVALTLIMNNGDITLVAKDKKATTPIRWETKGITITREKITSRVTSKRGYTGPGPVSSAYGKGKGVLWATEYNKSVDRNHDPIVTTIKFTAQQVQDELGIEMDDITENTTLYLHAICDTYNWNEDPKKITIRKDYLRNWQDVLEAEWWSKPETYRDFEKYYNMELKFKPNKDININTLYFQDESGHSIKDKDGKKLDSVNPGKDVSWDERDKKTIGTYKLFEYKVIKKNDKTATPIEVHKIGDTKPNGEKYTIDEIAKNQTKVYLGGMNIVLVYRVNNVDPVDNTLYYQSKEGERLYITEGGNKYYETDLGKVKPGNNVSWNEEAHTIIKTGKKSYSLMGYKAIMKADKKKTVKDEKYSPKTSLIKISNGSTKVYPGGMDVFLIYETGEPGSPTPPTSPTSTPKLTPTPKPSVTPIVVPEAETIQEPMAKPDPGGVIEADDRDASKFTAVQGVPTTESLYTEVGSNNYLLGYELEKKVGIETYSVEATKMYVLHWTGKDSEGNDVLMTDLVRITQYVNIQRAYGYWEINNFDYYMIHKAEISNYSLPDGKSTIYPDYKFYGVPIVNIRHSSDKDDHILKNDQIINGVTLPSETIYGGTSRPTVKSEDFTEAADNLIPDVNVKNDFLEINGLAAMSDKAAVKEGYHVQDSYLSNVREMGANRCNKGTLYKPNQIIEAKKKNGIFHSSGIITYKRVNSVNSNYTDSTQYEIPDINSVVIHTPVLCDPIVTEDNDKYVQLIHPSNAKQVVLDPDAKLNDFTLKISNYGHHSYKQGYYTRDFSRSLRDPDNVSYIASEKGILLNEVKFPFDVYIHQSDGNKFIKKFTWVVLGRDTATFNVPMWVQEGVYTVSCRTIAVNADMDKLDQISEPVINSKLENYVATNTFDVEVSGRMYGLSIYDLTDYPMWKEAFRGTNSLKLKINDQAKYPDGTCRVGYSKNYSYDYTVGTNDQYGYGTRRNVKYTFPLVNGSHPFYKNIGVLKTGYVVRFKLNTVGTLYGSGCKVRIKPTFYYVDAKGENRTRVDIYYEEEINGVNRSLIKMGNNLDILNQKSMEAGSPKVGMPKQEMKDTANILNVPYKNFIYKRDNLFSFTRINIVSTFRTFINNLYTRKILNSSDYDKVRDTGVTSGLLMKQMQSWYGCYYLPSIMHAVDPKDVPYGWTVYQYAARKGITYHENWWKKNGYIIVNFDIVTVDSEGNEHLSYINADNYINNNHCSMWTMEGAPLSKKDNKGVTFQFKPGDFVIYYVDKSIHTDYRSDVLY